jgi:hypothetical protein
LPSGGHESVTRSHSNKALGFKEKEGGPYPYSWPTLLTADYLHVFSPLSPSRVATLARVATLFLFVASYNDSLWKALEQS